MRTEEERRIANNAHKRAWRLRNPEKMKQARESWEARHPEKRQEYIQRYNLKHRQRIKERGWKWKQENPDKVKEVKRNYRNRNSLRLNAKVAEWRRNNPEKVASQNRKWREENRAKRCAYASKRRALSIEHLSNIYDALSLRTFCHWCSGLLTPKNRTVDHVMPLSRGGRHSEENLVACCRPCNERKGVKLYWEWDGELAA